MLLVSAVPIGLYHRQVLQLSQEKLVDTELVQQADLTRSLAREIQLFEANLTQQLVSERQIMALMGLSDNVEDPVAEPKVTRLLESFADSNRETFLYLTAVGKTGKGTVASQDVYKRQARRLPWPWRKEYAGEWAARSAWGSRASPDLAAARKKSLWAQCT